MTNPKNIFEPLFLLRLFIGLIFLSAGFYRIFHWQEAVLELSKLNLNFAYLPVLIIGLEIIGGLLLILNIKTKKVLLVFIVFISMAIIGAFLSSGREIILKSEELFVFNPTPTDTFLHFTYLIILIYLLNKKEG